MYLRPSIGALRAFSTRHGRVFPQFSVYGSDALFQLSPIAPVYSDTGKYLKLKRGGSLMLTWCKSSPSGYDYQGKHFFGLTPAEIGSLLNTLDMNVKKFSLVRSPNMNAPQASDAATKTFAVEFQPEHHKTVFEYTSGDVRAAVALTSGEVRVFKELLQYSLPYLCGFHSVLDGELSIETENGAPSASSASRNYKSKPTSGDWPF
ncbi:hypothetical protein AeRB84_000013 [Aphanomyces euteiches]|nr:hypothetical protein AeRB84_000013 [Aphanomyces euteiches]